MTVSQINKNALMRHLIAGIGLVGAIFSALLSHVITEGTVGNHLTTIILVNLPWGLYYGLGFEPVFIWYKIHGPFATNFLDIFAMTIYPLIASGFLYWAIFKVCEPPMRRKRVVLALALSFLAFVPMPDASLGDWWLHPIWIFGAMAEPP